MAEVKFEVGQKVRVRNDASDSDSIEARCGAVGALTLTYVLTQFCDAKDESGKLWMGIALKDLEPLSPVAKPEPGGECMLKAGVRVRCVGVPADWDGQGRVGKIATLLEPTGVPETWRVRLENGASDNWAISPNKTRVDVLPSEQGAPGGECEQAFTAGQLVRVVESEFPKATGQTMRVATESGESWFLEEIGGESLRWSLPKATTRLEAIKDSRPASARPGAEDGAANGVAPAVENTGQPCLSKLYPETCGERCSFCFDLLGSHETYGDALHKHCIDQLVRRKATEEREAAVAARRNGPDPYITHPKRPTIKGLPATEADIALLTAVADATAFERLSAAQRRERARRERGASRRTEGHPASFPSHDSGPNWED